MGGAKVPGLCAALVGLRQHERFNDEPVSHHCGVSVGCRRDCVSRICLRRGRPTAPGETTHTGHHAAGVFASARVCAADGASGAARRAAHGAQVAAGAAEDRGGDGVKADPINSPRAPRPARRPASGRGKSGATSRSKSPRGLWLPPLPAATIAQAHTALQRRSHNGSAQAGRAAGQDQPGSRARDRWQSSGAANRRQLDRLLRYTRRLIGGHRGPAATPPSAESAPRFFSTRGRPHTQPSSAAAGGQG